MFTQRCLCTETEALLISRGKVDQLIFLFFRAYKYNLHASIALTRNVPTLPCNDELYIF